MIIVDIYVPSIDKRADFCLDENAPIADLLEEIGEMLAQNLQNAAVSNMEKLMLGSYQSSSILSPNMTLNGCGVKNGARLFLV